MPNCEACARTRALADEWERQLAGWGDDAFADRVDELRIAIGYPLTPGYSQEPTGTFRR